MKVDEATKLFRRREIRARGRFLEEAFGRKEVDRMKLFRDVSGSGSGSFGGCGFGGSALEQKRDYFDSVPKS